MGTAPTVVPMELLRRPFGSTGIEVSAIGLGAWQLGRSREWPSGPDPDEAVRIVHAALDAGVTFIDTAPGYAGGQSEINLGRALAGVHRDLVILCTKVGHMPDGGTDFSPAAIVPSVEGSARRLGVDHVDIVLLHNPPPGVIDSDEHYAVLEGLRDKGLIRAFGASVDQGAEVDTVLAASRSTALEVRLSALYQEPAAALDRARERGAGVIVKVPLESGWLSGRYDAGATFTDVRSRWSPDDVALRAELVDELRDLMPPGVSLVEGALRFLLAYDSVSTVIPGTRSAEHIRAAVAAVAEPLTPATVDAVREWYDRRLGGRALGW
jgi:aryl-alcohol dehydrogenase-like predicted oxidoreductase